MRKLAIGNDDFKEIRDNGFYFVDKTMLIDHILSRDSIKAFLFARPRRFGKSLNLSMLDAYLNMRYADDRDRFEGLRISEVRPDDPEKNSNIVVFLSLKDLGTDNYEEFISDFRLKAFRLYRMFMELRDSGNLDPSTKKLYESVYGMDGDESILRTCLLNLTEMLEMHYGRKSILLIDEYDNPMNNSYNNPDVHDRIVNFMRQLLGTVLKSNESLRFAVITGVMKISKESIFSGVNNLSTNDVLSRGFDEMYGFTRNEVMDLCRDYGHPEKYDEAMEWYDGYRFGDADVCNPWSILSYVDNGFETGTYWAGTSGNSIIDDLVTKADPGTWSGLRTLGQGGSLHMAVDRDVAYSDLHGRHDILYPILIMSGYLTAVPEGDSYLVSIPNKEMYRVFAKVITERYGAEIYGVLLNFANSVLEGDVDGMTRHLRVLMRAPSLRILSEEKDNEAFITGLLMLLGGRYDITADREEGMGYFDIRLKRLRGTGPNVLIELKRRNKGNEHMSMDELARNALDQIHDRRFYAGLEGTTILYGIAFDSKEPTIVSETLDCDD